MPKASKPLDRFDPEEGNKLSLSVPLRFISLFLTCIQLLALPLMLKDLKLFQGLTEFWKDGEFTGPGFITFFILILALILSFVLILIDKKKEVLAYTLFTVNLLIFSGYILYFAFLEK